MKLVEGISAFTMMFALTSASAMDITGLHPGAPAAFKSANAHVREHVLTVDHGQALPLTVSPWPDFLPQCFPTMTVSGERRLGPGGPSDRVTLTRDGEDKPFILIANGARANSRLVGDWRLTRAEGHWFFARRTTGRSTVAVPGAKLEIAHGNDQWTVHILDITEPETRPAAINETVPSVSWVAVRAIRQDSH